MEDRKAQDLVFGREYALPVGRNDMLVRVKYIGFRGSESVWEALESFEDKNGYRQAVGYSASVPPGVCFRPAMPHGDHPIGLSADALVTGQQYRLHSLRNLLVEFTGPGDGGFHWKACEDFLDGRKHDHGLASHAECFAYPNWSLKTAGLSAGQLVVGEEYRIHGFCDLLVKYRGGGRGSFHWTALESIPHVVDSGFAGTVRDARCFALKDYAAEFARDYMNPRLQEKAAQGLEIKPAKSKTEMYRERMAELKKPYEPAVEMPFGADEELARQVSEESGADARGRDGKVKAILYINQYRCRAGRWSKKYSLGWKWKLETRASIVVCKSPYEAMEEAVHHGENEASFLGFRIVMRMPPLNYSEMTAVAFEEHNTGVRAARSVECREARKLLRD